MISPKKTLSISIGQCTSAGIKDVNEDCLGVRIPSKADALIKGIVGVIADGVSDASGGKEAAEMCVQGFLSDYFSTPDSWTIKTSGQRILNALNRWLYSQGQTHGLLAEKGYLSTLSSIVLVAKTAYIFHIGDSRIYRIRDNSMEQLTRDHSTQVSQKVTYLNRAMGLNLSAAVDYHEVDVEEGDIFLLSTDGVHDWISEKSILETLTKVKEATNLDHLAEELVHKATAALSNDNLSSLIIHIDTLPQASHDDLLRTLLDRPFPPLLYPGQVLDGIEVQSVMFESARSQLYKVKDLHTGNTMLMKTPSTNFQDDPAYIERFITEEWIGKRTTHENLLTVYENRLKPTFLYYLMEHIEGISLATWAEQNKGKIEVSEVVNILKGIVGGVRAMHRLETLHQDLKPDNIMITTDNKVKIIDYGACRVANIHNREIAHEREENLGTIDYGAPEYRYPGGEIGPKSDQFSIAMIAYSLLTGDKNPYGERWKKVSTLKDFNTLEYTSSYHHSPTVPHWLDCALKKALNVQPSKRYSSMSEFIHDLETPNPAYVKKVHLPYLERNPVRFWQVTSGILTLVIIWLLVLLNT